MKRWEYCTLEWIWAGSSIRINTPVHAEQMLKGSYQEVVALLCEMGRDCWEVTGKVACADWVYWTLKRPME